MPHAFFLSKALEFAVGQVLVGSFALALVHESQSRIWTLLCLVHGWPLVIENWCLIGYVQDIHDGLC